MPDGFNIGINVGAAAGQTVFHLHVHLIPRYLGDVPNPRGGVRGVIPDKRDYSPTWHVHANRQPRPPRRPLVRGGDDPVLPLLREHIDSASRVDIAVAFVLPSGVRVIEEHLRDLLARGGSLRLITGDYLDVTDPDALARLLDLSGEVDLRVFETHGTSFHPKAYIFQKPGGDSVAFVGSSNLTGSALRNGVEWNYGLRATEDREGFADVADAFERLLDHDSVRPLDHAWIEAYRRRRRSRVGTADVAPEPVDVPPKPHAVQREALDALAATRTAGNAAGLVVLATGLGKTWLSAFDSSRPEFRRVLFVAHRGEILDQARRTFRRIRPTATLGYYTGTAKEADADVLFASIQTIGQKGHLDRFDPDAFDYIVVDEFHHASARTYRGLIDHFRPKFLLGLTATPERTDGGDLLSLCHENLVYRCDVWDGIRRGLLSPFAYFGVPDEVDYANIPWRGGRFDEEELTRHVATQARAQNAFEQYIQRKQLRTLAFCVSTRHADFMAEFFRERGVRAVSVHSGPTSAPRAGSLEELEDGAIDVIFAVDIFNEGLDLPNIDTVLMLRPTESQIIWQQQFGRGLRQVEGKRLTVVDYIGNHRAFLLKPQALLGLPSGDAHIREALERLQSGTYGLPPGCEVTYELQAIEIVRGLLREPSATEALRQFYEDFRYLHEVRPTAAEVFHEGFNPKSVRATYGSWLGFVRAMGDLTDAKIQAYKAAREFLESLDVTQMSKSYKMLVLLAMHARGRFPGEITIAELVDGVREMARRSAAIRADLGVDIESELALRQLLEQNPIAAWVGGLGTGGVPYFDYVNGVFRTKARLAVAPYESLAPLVREIVDWRLAAYLQRTGNQSVGRPRAVFNVSHANGRPILFLDRERNPDVPCGSTPLHINGEEHVADFVEIALNVVRKPGGGPNQLSEILRGWFGSNAGLPGTAHRVVLEYEAGRYTLKPLRGADRNRGLDLWQTYRRTNLPTLFGAEYSRAVWQTGFVRLAKATLLLVTLEKRDMAEEHRYEDRFLSPDELQWQSQNRTRRETPTGRSLRDHQDLGIDVHLFVRKQAKGRDGRATPFTYCGLIDFVRWEGDKPITVYWRLRNSLPDTVRRTFNVSPEP